MADPSSPKAAAPGRASPKGKGDKSAVKVMVRIRPFNSRELAGLEADEYPTSILHFDGKRVTLLDRNQSPVDHFDFHETFWSIPEKQKQYGVLKPFADQEHVFEYTGKPAVDTALAAKHCCIFAYGQTGTGKSYTMLGSIFDPGIAPRIVDHLFERLQEMGGKKGGWEYSVDVSFMEIYNEKVKDLLVEEARDLGFIGAPSSPGSPGGSQVSGSPGRRKSIQPGRRGSPTGLERRGSPAGADRRQSHAPGAERRGSPAGERRGSHVPRFETNPVRSETGQSVAGRRKSLHPRLGDEEEYQDLKVRQSPEIGVFVEGLCRLGKEQGLTTADDYKQVMRRGMEHRATAETQMNATSSRSHAIFSICLRMNHGAEGKKRYAQLNLVDLAGSERVTMSGATGQTLVEATRINLSLSTLRRVIDTLVSNQTKKKPDIPPFRESMLTWVLSESLGGNSETMMLATVSPAESNREDTMNTLRYAAKAKKIENTVRVNEQAGNVALGAMQAEMERLRQELKQDQAGEGSLDRLNEAAEEAQQKHMQQLEELEREREEHQRRLEEMAAAQQERDRLDEEAKALKEQNIEQQHHAAEEEARRAEEAHRRAEQERLQREEEKRVKEELARLEARRRDELEQLRHATEVRKHAQETEANLLRRKQFALAFSKAFAKTTAGGEQEEQVAMVRQTKDHVYQGEKELQRLTGQIRELEMHKGTLKSSTVTANAHHAQALETHGEVAQKKRGEVETHSRDHREAAAALQVHAERLAAAERRLAAESADHERFQQSSQERRSEVHAQRERRRRRRDELESKTGTRSEELQGLRKLSTGLRQESSVLRDSTRDARVQSAQLSGEATDLDEENVSLREQLLKLKDSAASIEHECRVLAERRASLKEIIADRQSSHDELKNFVQGRFFAAGVVRQGGLSEDPQVPTRSLSPAADGKVFQAVLQDRVWTGMGYADRSLSPEATARASPRAGTGGHRRPSVSQQTPTRLGTPRSPRVPGTGRSSPRVGQSPSVPTRQAL
eukprot:TRINITY_DN211_c1_g2_i1.p1 TRINITY_DN211_c1_g2~~TRINITY_DN211_c1_g2_i1.p1  ORF type:complete len:1048 (+),score=308.73 TRINITY_DN211_c1_g2_i1:94-3144(+)